MFIKTADGSYINANHIRKLFINEDTATKTYDVCAQLAHDEIEVILASFVGEPQAQSFLDDLATKLNTAFRRQP